MSEFNLSPNISSSQTDNELEVTNNTDDENTIIYGTTTTQISEDSAQEQSLQIEQQSIQATSEIFEHSKTEKFEWNSDNKEQEPKIFEDEKLKTKTPFSKNNDQELLQEKSDIYRSEAVGLIAPSIIFVTPTQKTKQVVERSQPGTRVLSSPVDGNPKKLENCERKMEQPLESGLKQNLNQYIFRGAAIALTITAVIAITNEQSIVKTKQDNPTIILQSKKIFLNTKQATQKIYKRIKEIEIMEKNNEKILKSRLKEKIPEKTETLKI